MNIHIYIYVYSYINTYVYMLIYKYAAPLGLNNMVLQTVQGCGQIGGGEGKASKSIREPFPILG